MKEILKGKIISLEKEKHLIESRLSIINSIGGESRIPHQIHQVLQLVALGNRSASRSCRASGRAQGEQADRTEETPSTYVHGQPPHTTNDARAATMVGR